jgi:hypothetical protein
VKLLLSVQIDLSLVNILIVLIKEAVGIKRAWSCLCHLRRGIRDRVIYFEIRL